MDSELLRGGRGSSGFTNMFIQPVPTNRNMVNSVLLTLYHIEYKDTGGKMLHSTFLQNLHRCLSYHSCINDVTRQCILKNSYCASGIFIPFITQWNAIKLNYGKVVVFSCCMYLSKSATCMGLLASSSFVFSPVLPFPHSTRISTHTTLTIADITTSNTTGKHQVER